MTKKASYGRIKETTIGGFVMPREYRHIKDYEREIEELRKEGFIFQQLTSNLTAPQSLKDAIDAKNRTTQEAYQAENKLRQAEAEAKAKIIAAEAEKKVNDLKASALTPLIIQQMYIEKWDGKLPTYGAVPQLFQSIQNNQ